MAAAAMPGPRSATTNCTRGPTRSTVNSTDVPGGAYFAALSSRL